MWRLGVGCGCPERRRRDERRDILVVWLVWLVWLVVWRIGQ
jgi:hypothetical protein